MDRSNTSPDMTSFGTGAEGVKDDKDKMMARLIFSYFPRSLKAVGRVSTMGAKKYKPYGWESVPDALVRYDDAMGRHYLERYIEEIDPESDEDHLAHIAWNALAILELKLREKK